MTAQPVSPPTLAPAAASPTDDATLRRLTDLAQRSVELIRTEQDEAGAYPAASTFSAYRGYAWLRDGSFTAEAMSRWAEVESANRFHDWVTGVLTARRAQVERVCAAAAAGSAPDPADLLPTRFTLAGADGADDWWDFQTDGYGTWLWALTTHLRRYRLHPGPWLPGMMLAVDYLIAVGDQPCYDWWEEHREHRHTSTLAAVRAGLLAAATLPGLGDRRRAQARSKAAELAATVLTAGRTAPGPHASLAKWIGSTTVDGSLPACVVPFQLVPVDHPIASTTLDAVAAALEVDGGVHRFVNDVFYGGGQWPLLSCLLGWNRAAAGDNVTAWRYLIWAAGTADHQLELPEQTPQHLLHPEARAEWIQRWGPVARPLIWSHAMFLILADELDLPTSPTPTGPTPAGAVDGAAGGVA